MFANAYKKATKFTRPVLIFTRTYDGDVKCGCGSYILLNNEGWILTVAHILNALLLAQQHKSKIEEYDQAAAKIKSDQTLKEDDRQRKLGEIFPDKKWITNNSYWWGNGIQIDSFKFFYEGDIAIAQIKNFKPAPDMEYPKFKNPKNLQIGTFLCKLGFPFQNLKATFDEAKKTFALPEGTFPMPFFPIEGMYTRNVNVPSQTNATKFKIKYLETSTPGLKGQSGGPIFDREGVIYAVQSRTLNYSLDFTPAIEKDGKKIEENQFFNVGWGVHPELIFDFLDEYKVKFEIAD